MYGLSDKTCSQIGWYPNTNNAQVCGGSINPIDGQCSGLVNYSEAVLFCNQFGSRLCTELEVATDIAKGSNVSGTNPCSLDYERIWTSTTIGCTSDQTVITRAGSSLGTGNISTRCQSKINNDAAYVRCCGDVSVTGVILSRGIDTISYPPPVLSKTIYRATNGANGPFITGQTSRGEPIYFNGSNFMIPNGNKTNVNKYLTVYVGPDTNPLQSLCYLDINNSNDTYIRCTVPSGTGTIYFTVSVGGQQTRSDFYYLYPPGATIFGVTGCPGGGRRSDNLVETTDCPTIGGVRITLNGSSFPDPATIAIGSTFCNNVEIIDNNTAECILPPGTGVLQQVVVSDLAFTKVSASVQLISYAAPQILEVSSNDCLLNTKQTVAECNRKGGTLTISGINFGVNTPTVFVGGSPCTNITILIIDSLITCQFLPGQTLGRTITILQNSGTLSTEETFVLSYHLCPIGYYEPIGDPKNATSMECLECPQGKYNDIIGAGFCFPCLLGRFSNQSHSSECLPCALGFFNNMSGQSDCTECSQGTYGNSESLTTCVSCEAGKFNNLTMQSVCQSCSSGSYEPNMGQTTCNLCNTGYFSNAPAQVTCQPCSSGYYVNTTGASICNPCLEGSAQSSPGQSHCDLCSYGTSAAVKALSNCLPCELGKYSNSYGLTTCDSCAAGLYTDIINSTNCSLCPAGRYSDTNGSKACSACPSGYYLPLPSNQTSCLICDAGTYSDDNAGASVCMECSIGFYQTRNGSKSCLGCDIGRYSNLTRFSMNCLSCPYGKFAYSQASTYCDDCTPGWAAPSQNSATCLMCEPGRYAPGYGSSSCILCEIGKYNNISGVTKCLDCIAGTANNLIGQYLCPECSLGSYQPNNASSSCISCEIGKFSNSTGVTECFSCEAGTSNSLIGQYICPDCPLGRFSNLSGVATCDPCPLRYHVNRTGQTMCDACLPTQHTYEIASTDCTNCLPNTYALQLSETNTVWRCIDCPAGASCANGSIYSNKGYWLHIDAQSSMAVVFFCKNLEACQPLNQCAENREPFDNNPLCGSCLPNYYEWSGRCVPCDTPERSIGYTVLFLISLWLYVIVMHVLSQSSRSETKILMYFVQNLLLYFTPETGGYRLSTYLFFFNFNIMDSDSGTCIAPFSPLLKLVFGMIIPMIMLIFLAFTLILHFLYWIYRHGLKGERNINDRWVIRRKGESRVKFALSPYLRTMLGFMIFSYNSITKSVFDFMACVNIPGHSPVVKNWPAISCDSLQYKQLYPLMIVLLLVVVVLFPICLGICLLYFQRRGILWTEKIRARCGILFENYRKSMFFWEVVVLARRSVLIALSSFITDYHRILQAMMIMNIFILVSHMYFTPFSFENSRQPNQIETLSLTLLTIIAAILSQADLPLSEVLLITLCLVAFLPTITLMVIIIVNEYKELVRETVNRFSRYSLQFRGSKILGTANGSRDSIVQESVLKENGIERRGGGRKITSAQDLNGSHSRSEEMPSPPAGHESGRQENPATIGEEYEPSAVEMMQPRSPHESQLSTSEHMPMLIAHHENSVLSTSSMVSTPHTTPPFGSRPLVRLPSVDEQQFFRPEQKEHV